MGDDSRKIKEFRTSILGILVLSNTSIIILKAFKEEFCSKLLTWYRKFGRDLPWRKTDNPYHILVSEIFLHQTQVKTVIPFYNKFLTKFPSIYKLANANLEDVKAETDGLGYKIRGQWLHNIAKILVEKYQGIIPDSFDDLIALEGIGRYTAGAILSFAYKKRAFVQPGRRSRTGLYLATGFTRRRPFPRSHLL